MVRMAAGREQVITLEQVALPGRRLSLSHGGHLHGTRHIRRQGRTLDEDAVRSRADRDTDRLPEMM